MTDEPGRRTAEHSGAQAELERRPVLRLVRGEPTPTELAALVAVLSARSSAGAPEQPAAPSLWRDRGAPLRAPLQPGPGSWRASGLPR